MSCWQDRNLLLLTAFCGSVCSCDFPQNFYQLLVWISFGPVIALEEVLFRGGLQPNLSPSMEKPPWDKPNFKVCFTKYKQKRLGRSPQKEASFLFVFQMCADLISMFFFFWSNTFKMCHHWHLRGLRSGILGRVDSDWFNSRHSSARWPVFCYIRAKI